MSKNGKNASIEKVSGIWQEQIDQNDKIDDNGEPQDSYLSERTDDSNDFTIVTT